MAKYTVIYTDRFGKTQRWSQHKLKRRAQESLKEAKIYQPSARITTKDINFRQGQAIDQQKDNPFGFDLGGF